jgi:hypothetical protein
VLAVELYGLMEEEIAIVEAFESRITRKEAKGTKGDVSCFVDFAPFVVFVFQRSPLRKSFNSSKSRPQSDSLTR